MCKGLPKQFKKAQKQSELEGWRWVKKTNHVLVYDANGDFVVAVSTTMYDGTTTRKILGKLRNAGCPGV